eukprot:Colp12_sorted_trinity150504_noHs@19720
MGDLGDLVLGGGLHAAVGDHHGGHLRVCAAQHFAGVLALHLCHEAVALVQSLLADGHATRTGTGPVAPSSLDIAEDLHFLLVDAQLAVDLLLLEGSELRLQVGARESHLHEVRLAVALRQRDLHCGLLLLLAGSPLLGRLHNHARWALLAALLLHCREGRSRSRGGSSVGALGFLPSRGLAARGLHLEGVDEHLLLLVRSGLGPRAGGLALLGAGYRGHGLQPGVALEGLLHLRVLLRVAVLFLAVLELERRRAAARGLVQIDAICDDGTLAPTQGTEVHASSQHAFHLELRFRQALRGDLGTALGGCLGLLLAQVRVILLLHALDLAQNALCVGASLLFLLLGGALHKVHFEQLLVAALRHLLVGGGGGRREVLGEQTGNRTRGAVGDFAAGRLVILRVRSVIAVAATAGTASVVLQLLVHLVRQLLAQLHRLMVRVPQRLVRVAVLDRHARPLGGVLVAQIHALLHAVVGVLLLLLAVLLLVQVLRSGLALLELLLLLDLAICLGLDLVEAVALHLVVEHERLDLGQLGLLLADFLQGHV